MNKRKTRGYGRAEVLSNGEWIAAETKFKNGRHWVSFNGEFWPVSYPHSDNALIVLAPGDRRDVRMHDWSEA